MSEITTIGLDLAKNVFQVTALMHRADVASFYPSSRDKIPVSWALKPAPPRITGYGRSRSLGMRSG